MWCADVGVSLIEEREKERALERQRATQFGGKDGAGQMTLTEDKGQSRGIVAATVGMSESKE